MYYGKSKYIIIQSSPCFKTIFVSMDLTLSYVLFASASVHFIYVEKNSWTTFYVLSIVLDVGPTKVGKTPFLSSKNLQSSSKDSWLKDRSDIA